MNNADNPAMPVTFEHEDVTAEHFGVTKREYFAIEVLKGLLANPYVYSSKQAVYQEPEWGTKRAVHIADALLAALEKEAT